MFGLVVVAIIAIYVASLIAFPIAGYKIAAKWTDSRAKRWSGAALGFAVIFVPAFWDTVPTLSLHRHYCDTESGFTVYKTLDQWKLENPEAFDMQVKSLAPQYSTEFPNRVWLTQRIYVEASQNSNFAHALGREEQKLVDGKTGEILARSVNF